MLACMRNIYAMILALFDEALVYPDSVHKPSHPFDLRSITCRLTAWPRLRESLSHPRRLTVGTLRDAS